MQFTTEGQVHILSKADARQILDGLEEIASLIADILEGRRLTLRVADTDAPTTLTRPTNLPSPSLLDDLF